MSIESSVRGLAHEAGACVRANANRSLPVLALATAVLFTPAESRADSGKEWLEAAFRNSASPTRFEPPRKLGAYMPTAQRSKKKSNHVRTASLGPVPAPSVPDESPTTGGKIRWVANSDCLAPSLRAVIAHVAANFGDVRVSSTCRSHRHNRSVGGARKSYHLSGSAADFRLFGNVKAALAYLRSAVGGLKHYGGGLFHIDTGPRRPM